MARVSDLIESHHIGTFVGAGGGFAFACSCPDQRQPISSMLNNGNARYRTEVRWAADLSTAAPILSGEGRGGEAMKLSSPLLSGAGILV